MRRRNFSRGEHVPHSLAEILDETLPAMGLSGVIAQGKYSATGNTLSANILQKYAAQKN